MYLRMAQLDPNRQIVRKAFSVVLLTYVKVNRKVKGIILDTHGGCGARKGGMLSELSILVMR